jgi:small subunit ribosomal protein S1
MDTKQQAAGTVAAGAAGGGNSERDAMARMYAQTFKDFAEGSVVPGKVIEVRGNEVLVDIGYKSEGVVPADEFPDLTAIKSGDVLDVYVVSMEDDESMVLLSHERAEQQRRWNHVLETYKEGTVVEGDIRARVKGGLIVDVGGVESFLPGSQVDLAPVHDPDGYVGKRLEFKIIKINHDRRNIVLSRRELLEDRRRDRKRELLAEIKVGQVRRGAVKNITDFGAFVDLDGMDGLLHVTDMSWGRVNHPSEVVSVGQELEVVVLDVNVEKERVSLGLKQRMPNPWDGIESKYPVGSRLRGKIVNLVPYGAFVEIEPGVEGLVHVSEISWTKRIARASDVLSAGQDVDVVVLNVNKEEQKIALGIRQTEENPWDGVRERYPIGARVGGKVRNLTSYGAFVELEDGIDGMIHVSDLSWTRKVNHPSEVLKKGDEVAAVVLEVDPDNQRISLGLKQTQEDPWATIGSRYKVGQVVAGKVSKLASFGAFVELEEGIDGLVHISQISDERVDKIKDVLKPGQEVRARIVRIDPVERRIGLSIKAASVPDEEFVVKEEMLQGLRPGEDLVDLAGAFDAAFSQGAKAEEWHPGDKASTAEKADTRGATGTNGSGGTVETQ